MADTMVSPASGPKNGRAEAFAARWAVKALRFIHRVARAPLTREGVLACVLGLLAQSVILWSVRYEGEKLVVAVAVTLLAGIALAYGSVWPWPAYLVNLATVLVAAKFTVFISAEFMVAQFFVCLSGSLFVAGVATALSAAVLMLREYWEGRFLPVSLIVYVIQDPVVALVAARALRSHVRARLHSEQQAWAAELKIREDRFYLARELHDILNHSVSTMSLQAGGALSAMPADDRVARTALTNILAIGHRSAEEISRTTSRIRNADTNPPPVRLHTLDEIVELVAATGVPGRRVKLVQERPTWDPNPEQHHAMYRFVQEGLTNAFRHGKPDSTIRVTVAWAPDQLSVEVENEISGPTRSARREHGGNGLSGLEQRALAVGGRFEMRTERQRFLIRMSLTPIAQNDELHSPRQRGGPTTTA